MRKVSMVAVLVGETGPLRPIFSVTDSPRLMLVWVVKPPRSGLFPSLPRQALVPVLHWFSLTTGFELGQATSACAWAGRNQVKRRSRPSPNTIEIALRGPIRPARIPSGRRPRTLRVYQSERKFAG